MSATKMGGPKVMHREMSAYALLLTLPSQGISEQFTAVVKQNGFQLLVSTSYEITQLGYQISRYHSCLHSLKPVRCSSVQVLPERQLTLPNLKVFSFSWGKFSPVKTETYEHFQQLHCTTHRCRKIHSPPPSPPPDR